MRYLHTNNNQIDLLHERGSHLKRFAYALSRFRANRTWLSKGYGRAELEMYLGSLIDSHRLIGVGDFKMTEVDKLFPHDDVSRMFYATLRQCESFHLNYNAHIVLHTEPSRWLRLSYHLGCTPTQTEVSPTFAQWHKKQYLGSNYNSFHEGIPIERIWRDALTHSDLAYDYAGDLNFDNGLNMLSNSMRAKYEDDGELADLERFEVFKHSISDHIW